MVECYQLLLHDCVIIIVIIGLALLGTLRLFQSFCKTNVISKVHQNLVANLQRSLQKVQQDLNLVQDKLVSDLLLNS